MRASSARGRSSWVLSTVLIAALLLVLAVFMPGTSSARPDRSAELSPVAFQVISRPLPVVAADGRKHLSYEIQAVNQSSFVVTIDRIQARAKRGTVGKALSGESLLARTRLNGKDPILPPVSATLGAGESAMFFIDASYGKSRKNPKAIKHAITMSWPDPANLGQTIKQTIVGVNSKVSKRNVIQVAPPLRGNNWVAASSCCTLNPHRGATLAIDGTIRVPERFAIDFIRLNTDDRLFNGLQNDLGSYDYFGTRIHSATKGKVVRVQDGRPEQVPGTAPADATVQNAGGNHVVVDMGHGRFAFYAHMKTGSTRVNVGDKVKVGQVLGLLGNTGNTDAPHLHFHIMDSQSPLQANGLPFTFKSFTGQGVVTDPDAMIAGGDPLIKKSKYAGRHKNQLTMDWEVVNFGR